MDKQKVYIAIDLKSFYASVECIERNLDPLTTNLVVADSSRTEKTICLAVTPSLKKYGIPGRARLFEVIQKVNEINYNRIAVMLIDEFRGGKLGKISLERPDDVFEEEEVIVKEETEKERKRRIRKEKRNEKKKEKR